MTYPLEVKKLSGLNYDLPAAELPEDVYTTGRNIRYDNLAMCKFDGHSIVFSSGMLHAPYHLVGVRQPLDYFWIYPGASAIGVVGTSGGHNDITPVGGVSATYIDNWTGGVINGVPYVSNPNEDPLFWDGVITNPMAVLTGWPASTKAKVIRTYQNFLVALDLTESSVNFPNKVKWSASAAAGNIPASWDDTDPALDAGEIILAGTQGALVDCLPLYSDNIVYKNNSAFVMTFTGGQQVFTFRELFQDIGVMGRDCVAYFKGRHIVLSQDDIIVHDGRTPTSLLDKRMRSWLFRELNYDHQEKSFLVPYHKKDEIWACFPNGAAGSDGLPNQALVWNYKDDKFSIRDLPDSPFISPGIISQFDGPANWDADTAAWDDKTTIWNENQIGSVSQDLMMCSASNLYEIDIGMTFDGVEYQSFVERLSMPLGSYSEVKTIRSVWPNIDGQTGTVIKIRIGGQMHFDDPIAWSSEGTYTIGTDDRFDSFATGRLISFRLLTETGGKWTLHGIGFESKATSRY